MRVGGGLVLRHADLGGSAFAGEGRPLRIRQPVRQRLPSVALRVPLGKPVMHRSIRASLVTMSPQDVRQLMAHDLREHRFVEKPSRAASSRMVSTSR